MLALQILAALFLFLSAALFFGPQLVIYGPRAVRPLMRNGQAKFVGGVLVSACAVLVTAPYMAPVVVKGGEAITMAALEIFTMQFGLI